MAEEIIVIVDDTQEDVTLGVVTTISEAPEDGSTYGRKDKAWEVIAGSGDMLKSTYDPTNKNADAFDYNQFSNKPTTITPTQASDITTNNAKETNIAHPLVETAVPVGAVFTDTVYDDTTIQAEVDLNTAKVGITPTQASDITTNNAKETNIAHPLVETAVPLGALFTDTVYDDTAIQAEVDTKQDILTAGANIDITNNVISSEGGGTTGQVREPIWVTLNQPDPVDEGNAWSSVGNALDHIYPGIGVLAYDYTGTPGTFTELGVGTSLAGQEPVPGTYTLKVRAGWAFGQSEEQTLTIQVNPFTLNKDNMFGDLTSLQGTYDISSATNTGYIGIIGAVVNNGGAYEIDRDGSVQTESLSSMMMYDFDANRLVAFRISATNVVEGVYYWTGITTVAQGTSVTAGASFLSVTGQKTAAANSSVRDLRAPFGGYYNGGLGGTKALSMINNTGLFDGFGSKGSWSYAFLLDDDWISSGTISQMLSPVGTEYFVNAIGGFGLGSSPYEYIHYGDDDSGPYNTSSNSVSWNISTNNWIVGNKGDLVVVTHDGTNWRIYMEGVLIYQNTSPKTYMDTTTTPTEIRFGDVGGSNATGHPIDYNKLGGWPYRLGYVAVASSVAFDQTQVTELVASKADLTLSTNYASIDVLGTFTSGGVVATKGDVAYSRVEVEF